MMENLFPNGFIVLLKGGKKYSRVFTLSIESIVCRGDKY